MPWKEKLLLVIGMCSLPVFLVAGGVVRIVRSKVPQHQSWTVGQGRRPRIVVSDGEVFCSDVRDFLWTGPFESVRQEYRDMRLVGGEVVGASIGVSRFSSYGVLGHVFAIFLFRDGKRVVFSLEARRARRERYTLWGGLLFRYELLGVIATYRDFTECRRLRAEEVAIYHLNMCPRQASRYFFDLARVFARISTERPFYHLLWRNCTMPLIYPLERAAQCRLSRFACLFTPGYIGQELARVGVIKNTSI